MLMNKKQRQQRQQRQQKLIERRIDSIMHSFSVYPDNELLKAEVEKIRNGDLGFLKDRQPCKSCQKKRKQFKDLLKKEKATGDNNI